MPPTLKHRFEELAIAGGKPAFDPMLYVGRPNLPPSEKFAALAEDIFKRRWLSNNGHYVQELERKLCEILGVKHCIPICNGTIALEIAIRALGMKDEVIVPSFTFIATPHALTWQEIKPVFCDIDPKTHLLDPADVERKITPHTTGIVAVHTWGQPCYVEELQEIADRHNIPLLFDAAHAFGCSHRGTMLGNFGRAEILSFHATKFFNTFEGGAIATNDDDLAGHVRLMKNFGFSGYDNAILVGTNGKMTEICAAMGLCGLECLEEFVSANRRNYDQYRAELADLPGVSLLAYDLSEKQNFQYVVADIDPLNAPLTRDEILKLCWTENELVRKYFFPGCHRMPAYGHALGELPATDRACEGVLVLPTGTAMAEAEIAALCELIRLGFESAPRVRQALVAS